MEAKLSQLKKATSEAEKEMTNAKKAYEDSQRRLDAAKELLQNMDEEDQKKIKINDTKLPELLELHSIAKDSYEVSQKKYETNKKYVRMIEEKLGIKTEE